MSENPKAFPLNAPPNSYHERQEGMTLRDWFAGQVMARMISLSEDRHGGWHEETVAHGSYQLADAMLKAREAKS